MQLLLAYITDQPSSLPCPPSEQLQRIKEVTRDLGALLLVRKGLQDAVRAAVTHLACGPTISACEHLTNLRSLFVHCKRTTLSDLTSYAAISQLGHLDIREVHLDDNEGCLVLKLDQLTSLRILDSDMGSLPVLLGLSQLQELHLERCSNLTYLLNSGYMNDLHSLTSLVLRHSAVDDLLPPAIRHLGSLQHLDLSYTSVCELPEDIAQLHSSLTSLNMEGSDIIELPACIGQLTNLRHLNLANLQELAACQ
jgi:Leucine-rich repeat (LRR) protein